MINITHLRCFNHAHREASALCPLCGRTFCRECVTEYEGRIVCTPCLGSLADKPASKPGSLTVVLDGTWCVVSSFLLWAIFYYVGSALQKIPTHLHATFSW